jgi:hypothetical protein
MIITNKLLKSCTLKTITFIKAEDCAEVFVQYYYRFHKFPKFITLNKGSNWIKNFWTRLCELVKIKQRLSIAFHLETDEATERINQKVQAYLKAFITYAQFDWPKLLSTAILAFNNRDTFLGISPFFLIHEYHVDPIQQMEAGNKKSKPAQAAENFAKRLQAGQKIAQAAIASAQQKMKDSANKMRQQAAIFRKGDHV